MPAHTGISAIDGLHLSPYRLVLLGMAVGSALKQNIWAAALAGEPMSVTNALLIGAYNTLFNSVNIFIFLASATSASAESTFPQPALIVAYTLWRAGYSLASGGWIWGSIAGAFIFADFATRAVPVLNEYCEKRYGTDWENFKKQTKWRLIPGVY